MLSRQALAALPVVVCALASPASAQSLFERAARAAASGAAEAALRNAVTRGSTTAPAGTAAAAASPGDVSPGASGAPADAAAAAASPAFAPPAPINYSPRLRGPYQLEFSADLEVAERAFDEFNRVPCGACEGGRSYDSWIRQHVPEVAPMNALEDRIGAMAVGEAIRWEGATGAQLALTVIGDQPVGPWPCKQVRWSSVRGDDAAERLGLFCNGKRGDYLGDGWVEVL